MLRALRSGLIAFRIPQQIPPDRLPRSIRCTTHRRPQYNQRAEQAWKDPLSLVRLKRGGFRKSQWQKYLRRLSRAFSIFLTLVGESQAGLADNSGAVRILTNPATSSSQECPDCHALESVRPEPRTFLGELRDPWSRLYKCPTTPSNR